MVELLSPAGDMERLKLALMYGADAVYLSGEMFGMRAKNVGFSRKNLVAATEYVHSKKKKIYITCNTLPRENEIAILPEYLEFLNYIGVDAIIAADLGVISLTKKYAPDVSLHISTQLGVVNSVTATELYNMGADTVVLARELSLEDIAEIKAKVPKELRLEAFVHGAMCVSFSGRCLLSNYLTGRDANRGQCAQPCRWKYQLVEETRPGEYYEITEDKGTFIMNSRDLRMIDHLPELLSAGVDSLKIEGRMKSSYYTATVTNAYRAALDSALNGEPFNERWLEETELVSHRPYSTGFFYIEPGQHYGESSYITGADIVGAVEEYNPVGLSKVIQRNRFFRGDTLELLLPGGAEPIVFKVTELKNEDGEDIDSANHAMMKLFMNLPHEAPELAIIRKRK